MEWECEEYKRKFAVIGCGEAAKESDTDNRQLM